MPHETLFSGALLLLAQGAAGFYLPGVAPREFADGDRVEVKVNKLTSTKNVLPFNYYDLAFCKPAEIEYKVENLGEVLHGSRIQNSPYELFAQKSDFKVLCKQDLTAKQAREFAKRIEQEYRVHMIMDNLPAATRMISELPDGRAITMYDRGFRLGFVGAKEFPQTVPGTPYLNNHLRFVIKFHKDEKFEGARLVGFEVEAFSVKHTYKGVWGKDAQLTSVPLSPELPPMPVSGAGEYIFTYDVTWEDSPIKWASRWDLYLFMGDDQIHWFSILNSLAIVLLLTGIVAMIMLRTLRRDFNRYNSPEEKEELAEESGWKLVHADVLRPPPLSLLLSASVGTGMQLLGMGAIAIAGAMLGFLSPANRGGLLTATLLLFVLMGVPAGYYASTSYKALKGTRWKLLTVTTATLYPGITFFLFMTLNFVIWGRGSSGAVPFGTILALIAMWFCISVPLVFLGAFFGFKQPVPEPPVRTNEIPRQVPEQAWYMSESFTMLIGGILPFGVRRQPPWTLESHESTSLYLPCTFPVPSLYLPCTFPPAPWTLESHESTALWRPLLMGGDPC
jgi:transmembrane 9 superfamily protein 2/4